MFTSSIIALGSAVFLIFWIIWLRAINYQSRNEMFEPLTNEMDSNEPSEINSQHDGS